MVVKVWNGPYIVLSFAISFVGSYTAVSLSEQFRMSTRLSNAGRVKSYLVFMSVSIGGGAIWCMHFVGMAAQNLQYKGEQITVKYDLTITILSLLASVIAVLIGLVIVTADKMYKRTEQEIVQVLSERAALVDMTELQNPYFLWKIAILNETYLICLGGVITGGGVCIMHYVGILAKVGPFRMHWNYGVVVASVFIACVAATTAYWILFRLLALYPRKEGLRVCSAVILSLAVCGMHYTGAAAASYEYDESADRHSKLGYLLNDEQAVWIALIGGLACNWFMTMFTLSDLRKWHYALSNNLRMERERIMTMTHDPDHLLRRSIHVMSQSGYYRSNASLGKVYPDSSDVEEENIDSDVVESKTTDSVSDRLNKRNEHDNEMPPVVLVKKPDSMRSAIEIQGPAEKVELNPLLEM